MCTTTATTCGGWHRCSSALYMHSQALLKRYGTGIAALPGRMFWAMFRQPLLKAYQDCRLAMSHGHQLALLSGLHEFNHGQQH